MAKKEKIKNKPNLFQHPQVMKEWAMEVSESCGSLITGQQPNVSKLQALIDKFIKDYNVNLMAVEMQQRDGKPTQEELEEMFKGLPEEEVERLKGLMKNEEEE